MIETVFALLMFINHEIKEHRIQDSLSVCLKHKRVAERSVSKNVLYKCIKSQAEIEINIDGTKTIKKLILSGGYG
jgi:hypothetical protein